MAFVVKDYGNGELGDVNSVSSTINSYARVTAVTTSTITINTTTQITGTATFKVGAKILLHVSATTSSSYKTYLGCYLLANVTAVNSGVLTLDADPTTCIPSANLAQYYVQAIAVAQYKNLTLNSGTTITPPVYNATNFVGGIVAIMCSEVLTFGGGHISLTDKGIPVGNKALRPTTQNDPIDDIAIYSGWENSDTHIHFMLNAGDGAAFIVAKSMVCDTNSRIGNTATRGYQFYRGATNSVTYNETKPSSVTNVGGSTILIAAQTITNFTPNMFAKYRSSTATAGQGICRCFIASETKLRNDEGLYAYDCISDRGRMKRIFGIKNFGNGSFGDLNNVTTQLNNYAKVVAINGNKVTYTGATTTGLAQFTQGAMVMIHWNHKNSTTVAEAGRFFIANVIDEYNGVLTLDAAPPNISITDYACQVVVIPQAKNFTLSTTNEATPVFQDGRGGICAIAVSENCNLSSGKITVGEDTIYTHSQVEEGYGRNGLAVIGNAQDSNKLPIGQGSGSIFFLAQNITMNEKTALGSAVAGNTTPGILTNNGYCGGYCGRRYNPSIPDTGKDNFFLCGSGANGGEGKAVSGGYGSVGKYQHWNGYQGWYCNQGMHIMIIARKITNFTLSAIRTGGLLIKGSDRSGSAGYGGSGFGGDYRYADGYFYAGGYNGGGGNGLALSNSQTYMYAGGSSGWAFIYCNEVVNQNTTGTILDN